MKNFETHFRTDGTAALQSVNSDSKHKIIEFPSKISSPENKPARFASASDRAISQSVLLRDLSKGSIKGRAFNQFQKWQVAVGVSTLSVVAAASIFIAG